MVAKKPTSRKTSTLRVKRETIKSLDTAKKARDVKGGQKANREGTRIASCGHTFGLLCC